MQNAQQSSDPAVLQEAHHLFLQAAALADQGQVEKALTLYQTVVLYNPAHIFAWSNMGLLLREAKRYATALLCAARALELEPENAVLLSNYGGALAALDRKAEALKASRAAVEKEPNHVQILTQHAITLREMGEAQEAAPYFDAACALTPDVPTLEWERAINNLILCRFDKGWPAFEQRWNLGKIDLHVYEGVPRWQGEDLNGKTILVYEEQGYGDTLLCARYLPLLKARGARVVMECTPPLLRLMQTVTGVDAVVARGVDAGERLDYQTPIMSLLGLFNTNLENIPSPAQIAVKAPVPHEAARLLALAGKKLKVGIVWSGRENFVQNHKRAVPLSRFFPFAEVPNVQLYSLQKGAGDEQVATGDCRGIIYELGSHIHDFSETAAILQQLDLVIMTDSGVAHLAGSMGVPVWNLLCYRPYWLYMQGREDSPWYPSMRLIRQTSAGDWDGVFKRAAVDLAQMAAVHR